MESTSGDEVCRLCATSLTCRISHDIFEGRVPYPFREPPNVMIERYCGIRIAVTDGMSRLLCGECGDRIVSFDDFVNKCVRVQDYLESLRDGKTFAVEVNYPDVAVKTEDDGASVKSEPATDSHLDDEDDTLPISKLVKRSVKKHRKASERRATIKKKKRTGAKSKVRTKSETDNEIKEDPEDCKYDDTKYKHGKINSKNSFFKFNCHECGEDCMNWFTLNNHCLKMHDTRARVRCVCDKLLLSRQSILRHFVKHGGKDGLNCEVCGKMYPDRTALDYHSYSHIPKEEYPHICSQCPKKFVSMQGLKLHEKTHIPKEVRSVHPCNICGLKFISKANVKIHANAVHNNSRPFVCHICGNTFSTRGTLHQHHDTHINVKTFQCDICTRRFKTKKQLQRHGVSHKDIKYKCSECPALLRSRRTLQIHMYIHEDKYRYVCAICGKAYKRKKSLKCHLNIHTGERPYSCLWCSRTFADNSNCRIHKKRVHPNELAEYEALHGLNLVIKKDTNEEPKIIYNTKFKPKRDDEVVVMPNLPDVTEESKTNDSFS